MNYPNMDRLLYWITERDNVRYVRQQGLPKPWSRDPVFQNTYFCNVRREHDKTTQWIRQNWPMTPGQEKVHLLAMCIARMVNKIDTLDRLGYPHQGWNQQYLNNWERVMKGATGVWGGAYIVSTNGAKCPKEEYIAHLLSQVWQWNVTPMYHTLASTHSQLTSLRGLGSFMGAQIIADLKNTPSHPLTTAPDWNSWCAPGPGSRRGMAWVMGKDIGSITEAKFREFMPALYLEVERYWPLGHMICAQDLQNCLCEFDKYMRVSTGSGRSKRKYRGAA